MGTHVCQSVSHALSYFKIPFVLLDFYWKLPVYSIPAWNQTSLWSVEWKKERERGRCLNMVAFQMCDLEQVTSNLHCSRGSCHAQSPMGRMELDLHLTPSPSSNQTGGVGSIRVVTSGLQLFICKTVDLSIKTPSTADMVLFYGWEVEIRLL